MKKVLLVFILIIPLFLSGCARSLQLSEKLLVQGLGIDFFNDQYTITLQTISSKESSGEKSSTPKKMQTIVATGKTIKEASYNIIKQTGKEPLYSQALILILGKGTIEQGLNNFIDFFVRHHEFSPDARVLISLTEAKKILNLKDSDEIIPSEDILAMLEEGPNKSKKLHSNIENIISDLKHDKGFVKISLIDIKKENEKETLVVERLGIFEDDKYLTDLDKEETKGALFISSKAKDMVDTIESKNFSRVSYTISKIKSKIKPEIQENMSSEISIKINANVDINESQSRISKKDFKNLESEISNKIKENCEKSLKKALIDNSCDIFEFSKMLIKEKPVYNKKTKKEILEILKKSNFKIDVKVNISPV